MEQKSADAMEKLLDEAFDSYAEFEREWIATRFGARWEKPAEVIAAYAEDFDRIVEEDRARYLEDLAAQNEMLEL